MAEVTVEFVKGEKYLTWYSDDFATIRHMKKLRDEYPDEVYIVAEEDDYMTMRVPINWFREPKPKAKREMTEEQRLAAKERLANVRSLKRT